MQNEILFAERQRFTQWWIWLLLILLNGLTLFAVVWQVLLGGQPLGNKPMSDVGIILVAVAVLLFSSLFFLLRLETQIKKDGIYVRFLPFYTSFRFYAWSQVSKSYVREYSPVLEYGGWGLRGLRKNKAWNVSGNKGLQLEFSDGKKLLIGTQKPDELNKTLVDLNQVKQ